MKQRRVQNNDSRAMQFMYEAPPGFVAEQDKTNFEAFAGESDEEEEREEERKTHKQKLEDKKLEQYPFIAMAPVEGDHVKGIDHTLNPVGIMLRNVLCSRCGQYGHQPGDKECAMAGVADAKEREKLDAADPLARIRQKSLGDKKFELLNAEDPIIGGLGQASELNTLLESSESSSSEEDELEASFMASLSKKQMKTLLKSYKMENKKAMRGMGEGKGGKSKKKKKEKKRDKKKEKKRDKRSSRRRSSSSSRSRSPSRERSKKKKRKRRDE